MTRDSVREGAGKERSDLERSPRVAQDTSSGPDTASAQAFGLDRGDPDSAPPPAHVAVQRVVVRMLFDPEFRDRVYDAPDEALAGLDLPGELVAQLRSNDRRLWSADRLRRSRALKVLMDELKVTCALVLAEKGRLGFLDAFFSSSHFHEAVQTRGYMALAFLDYLDDARDEGALARPQTLAVLHLEGEMARSRRALQDRARGVGVPTPLPDPTVAVAPGVRSCRLPTGVLEVVQHVERYLFETSLVPALALCDDGPRPEPLPPLGEDELETWLLEPEPGGKVELSGIPPGFHALITACQRAQLRTDVESQHGSDRVAALIEAGVLQTGDDAR